MRSRPSPARRILLAEIAKITPKPVKTAIITHSDGDHVNGLVAFPAGIKIIAHENNKKEQETALAAGGRGAPPADKLPNQVVTKTKEALTIDGVKLELYHFAPAHTSGDLIVFLPDQKICSTGDIVVTNRADDNPNVHFEKNGSTEGWLESVKGMIALNADTYVTGHGDLVDQGRPSAETERDDRASKQDCCDDQRGQDRSTTSRRRCRTLRRLAPQLAEQAHRLQPRRPDAAVLLHSRSSKPPIRN